jgi:hypothetical protein
MSPGAGVILVQFRLCRSQMSCVDGFPASLSFQEQGLRLAWNMNRQIRVGMSKKLPAAIRKKREKGNTVDRCVDTLFLHQSQAKLPTPPGSQALQ